MTALLIAGCWGDDAATTEQPVTPPLAKGEKLELNDTSPPESNACPECKAAAGPAHVCKASVWCATCNADATAEAGIHRCNVSHFCKGCGLEAAIAGHRCGETAFDPASLSDIDRDDPDGEGDDE